MSLETMYMLPEQSIIDNKKMCQVSALRAKIDCISDAESREGVMADVLSVVLVGLSQLSVSLAAATTLADVNAAAKPIADICAVIDTEVKAGTLKLPYMVKPNGAQGVLVDMISLSNGVSAVLETAQQAGTVLP
jgi:hypothetical protein